MIRFLLILILTLSMQSWTKADDIRDFQIEGMSVGDNLLDYFLSLECCQLSYSFVAAKTDNLSYEFESFFE